MRFNLILILTPWPISINLQSPCRFIEKTFYWCISDVANIRNIHLLLNLASRICNIANHRVNFATPEPAWIHKTSFEPKFCLWMRFDSLSFSSWFGHFHSRFEFSRVMTENCMMKVPTRLAQKCLCQIAFSLWHVEKENNSRLKSLKEIQGIGSAAWLSVDSQHSM